MNDREVNRAKAFKSVLVFHRDNAADFTGTTQSTQWFKDLEAVVGVINSASLGQEGGHATARSVLLDELRLSVKGLARTAHEIDEDEPGFADNFHLSSNPSQLALLTTAGRMLKELKKEGVAAKFLPYELPGTFVQDLEADLKTIDETHDEQDSNDTKAVASTATLGQAIGKGLRLLGKLNAAMNNKYARDPVKLAAWNTASHVERTPRRSKSSTGNDTGTSPGSETQTPDTPGQA